MVFGRCSLNFTERNPGFETGWNRAISHVQVRSLNTVTRSLSSHLPWEADTLTLTLIIQNLTSLLEKNGLKISHRIAQETFMAVTSQTSTSPLSSSPLDSMTEITYNFRGGAPQASQSRVLKKPSNKTSNPPRRASLSVHLVSETPCPHYHQCSSITF